MTKPFRNHGLTLIELLVAISVLTIVTALIIPRLRIVNKDRNIRETARVIGSTISEARDRAVLEGGSGVVIERNINFVAQAGAAPNNRVFYAGTRMYQLRNLQPYIGEANDFLLTVPTVDSNGEAVLRCFIPVPFEHDPTNNRPFIRSGDVLSVDGEEIGNPIKEVFPVQRLFFRFPPGEPEVICNLNVMGGIDMLPFDIAFDNDADPTNGLDTTQLDYFLSIFPPAISPPPPGGNLNGPYDSMSVNAEKEFSIARKRKIQSSVVDLPAGYIMDLRYSGPLDTGDEDGNIDTHTIFGLGIPTGADPSTLENREIEIHFDNRGGLDRLTFNGLQSLVGQSLFFFVDEFDPNNQPTGVAAMAESALSNPASLWVTVGFNGGINIGYNAPPTTGGAVPVLIEQARSVSRGRTSANQ